MKRTPSMAGGLWKSTLASLNSNVMRNGLPATTGLRSTVTAALPWAHDAEDIVRMAIRQAHDEAPSRLWMKDAWVNITSLFQSSAGWPSGVWHSLVPAIWHATRLRSVRGGPECAGLPLAEFGLPLALGRVLAMTSHIPQLIAYSVVGTATELETQMKDEVIKYSAAGFRDFTRLAGSDPVMWRDVYEKNKEAVLEMLGRFSEDLLTYQKAIRNNDLKYLEEKFIKSKEIRKIIEEIGQAGTFDPTEKN